MVKIHKTLVQICESFWTNFSKSSVNLSKMLVIISKKLIKTWSNFWKYSGQNPQDFVRYQYTKSPPPFPKISFSSSCFFQNSKILINFQRAFERISYMFQILSDISTKIRANNDRYFDPYFRRFVKNSSL